MISFREGKGAGPRKPPERILSLHLKLSSCQPAIWRRLLVRESMWLSRLHDAIQLAFEWYDYQTHHFSFGDLRFGNPAKRADGMIEDDRDATLADVDVDHNSRFTYRYDFDEGWVVEIAVEKTVPPKKGVRYPLCTGGERAGPPEDCGGPEAYHDMVECLKEPQTDLGREWREWLGPEYDPEACDLEKINRNLRKIGR